MLPRYVPPAGTSHEEMERHPSWRRHTPRYRAKKRRVRDIWILSGLVMLALPPHAVFALALATAFLGFAILDET